MLTSRPLLPLLALSSLLAAGTALAEEDDRLRSKLESLLPGGEVHSVDPTPVEGLFEVVVSGRIFYFTADGEYLLRGDLIEVASRRNLTEATRRDQRLAALGRLGEDSMIVFSPEDPKHTITVFTDVDCPYCARLHREVPKLNELGVKVRYTAFPRQGIPSENYDRMVSVWCASDPRQAMTAAKLERSVEPAVCENPVERHFREGQALGVGGTPTIVLDDGQLLGGYVPYQRLLQILESG